MSDRGIDHYKALLRIDRNDLDGDLMRQAQHFFDVSEQLVYAIDRRDTAHDELKRTAAKLGLRIRTELEEKGEKVTETRVDSEVRKTKEYQAAKTADLEASKEASLWEALKESFKSRGFALGELCGLYSSNYFQPDSAKAKGGAGATEQARYEQNKQRLAAGRKKLQEGE